MTYSNTAIVQGNCYEDVKEYIEGTDNCAFGRYDDMMKDFYTYVLGIKQNPFSYEYDYKVQKALDKIVGGVGFYGKNID